MEEPELARDGSADAMASNGDAFPADAQGQWEFDSLRLHRTIE